MRCGGQFGVTPVLVGLHRIGVVGLAEALEHAEQSGLGEREQIVDLILEQLATENYIPEHETADYRIAVWRELLRRRGEDPSEFYSEIAVTVCDEPGAQRDRFVGMLREIFGEFDLRPAITYEAASPEGPNPRLLIEGEVIFAGFPRNRWSLESSIRKSFSDW